jgi:two-component system, chemotaxis family, chemotaxis protein CheY
LTPRKILVVDDSKLMHRMYAVMLRDYPVTYALDGREGLERLRSEAHVELVLLDINMPVMNGLELLAAMKADERLAAIPVVIISTEGREEDTARGLEAGAVAYVTKPFRSDEIRRVIEGLEPPPA